MRGIVISVAIVAMATSAFGQRAPSVTYTATGSAGAWDLEFTLKNNFVAGEGQFYFFGVAMDTGRNILGSPDGWDPNKWKEWCNAGFGGSGRYYNNVWINLYSREDDILPNGSMSTWRARSTSQDAPTTLNFFAYAAEGMYRGTDHFSDDWNPGFEGIATLTPTPEPGSVLAIAFGGGLLLRRRSK